MKLNFDVKIPREVVVDLMCNESGEFPISELTKSTQSFLGTLTPTESYTFLFRSFIHTLVIDKDFTNVIINGYHEHISESEFNNIVDHLEYPKTVKFYGYVIGKEKKNSTLLNYNLTYDDLTDITACLQQSFEDIRRDAVLKVRKEVEKLSEVYGRFVPRSKVHPDSLVTVDTENLFKCPIDGYLDLGLDPHEVLRELSLGFYKCPNQFVKIKHEPLEGSGIYKFNGLRFANLKINGENYVIVDYIERFLNEENEMRDYLSAGSHLSGNLASTLPNFILFRLLGSPVKYVDSDRELEYTFKYNDDMSVTVSAKEIQVQYEPTELDKSVEDML